ncbi:MAG: hypothetical protein H0X24_11230 [Ktedonobacterales bacterium]|nr:hypothetical protein [Ktedonobacterales bacterium]
MQPVTSEPFITQMKLRELRRQRDKLMETYTAIEQRLAATPERSQAITILYEGLRDIAFAHNPLHPTVRQLDVLIHKLTTAQSSDDLLTFWLERLRQELATGHITGAIRVLALDFI